MKLLHHLDVGKILRAIREVVHVVEHEKHGLLQTYTCIFREL